MVLHEIIAAKERDLLISRLLALGTLSYLFSGANLLRI